MIRIKPGSRLMATPNPTTLEPDRRIELRLRGVYSTSPPEMADFEYTSERDDVEIEGGQPATRREKIDWGVNDLKEVAHRVVLRKAAGTDPPLAPLRLVVRGPNGERPERGTVVGLQPAGG